MRRRVGIFALLTGLATFTAGCANVDFQAPDSRQIPSTIPITLMLIGAVVALVGLFLTRQSKDPTSTKVGQSSLSVPLPGFVLTVGAMLVLAGAVLAYIGAAPITVAGPAATPGPTSPSGGESLSPSSPPVSPTRQIEILDPAEGVEVSASEGVLLKGVARGLKDGESLWVFDFDPGYEWHYYFVTEQPLEISGSNEWQIADRPLGDKADDVGTKYKIFLVIADEACGSALRTTKPNPDGDLALKSLPPGCTASDSVTVLKGRN